jgi:hypothetical protein
MPLRGRSKMKVQYISESIRNRLEDLKILYVDDHGEIPTWDDNLKMIFFLNCDVDLESLFRYLKITPDNSCFDIGISYGIMVLQTCLTQEYLDDRGVDEIRHLCLGDREILNNKINESIYNYIMDGVDI